MIKKRLIVFMWACLLLSSLSLKAELQDSPLLRRFVANMVAKHQFDEGELQQLFQSVDMKQSILDAMQRPAEGLPWYKYRKIFMTEQRIKGGIEFWQQHAQALQEVEKKYGVPTEIIIAIIGVETRYGGHTGHHRVIDALSTLAFGYPKRSAFFTSELENFLVLCRQQKMNPLQPTGSYAGAMGIPQFMPSSYLSYAADFEGDDKKDIWNNPADAIASVANYFAKHHWRTGDAIAFPVTTNSADYTTMLTPGLVPDIHWKDLSALSLHAQPALSADEKVKLLAYEQENGQDLWIGLHNFYVITRYNHSPLYAMAVYQLSQAIVQAKHKSINP